MTPSAIVRVAALACVAVLVAGCSVINPITTQEDYQPADGIEVAIGDDAMAQNLLVVTTALDAPAILTGSVYNGDVEELKVSFSLDGTHITEVTVPARGTAVLGPDNWAVIGAATAAPGGIVQVLIQADVTGQFAVPVPVLDGTQPEYQGVVDSLPTALPSPEPTVSASPEPSPTA